MSQVLLVADDLTGAADSGAQFARSGRRTLLALEPGDPQEADVLVLTSESRGLASGAQAAQAVRSALAACSPSFFKNSPQRTQSKNTNYPDRPQDGHTPHFASSVFPLVYKKIDSTLRGHPAAELEALMDALGEARVLIAPAFPAQGRTTLGGRVMVNGLPLEQTTFAAEVPTGDLRSIFGADAALLQLDAIRGGGPYLRAALRASKGMIIADAESEADLLLLAQAALAEGVRLWCGSAGLAGALVACLGSLPGASVESRLSPGPSPGNFLAVAGSLHPTTSAQVTAARRMGAVVVQPPPAFFTSPQPRGIAETAAQLAAALASGRTAVLSVLSPSNLWGNQSLDQNINGYTQFADAIPPAQIADRLAQTAAMALETSTPAGLFLTGGETARAVCQALGCTRLWLGGEVEPGIPWSHMADGRFPGLLVVTKAGGFGAEDSLARFTRNLGS